MRKVSVDALITRWKWRNDSPLSSSACDSERGESSERTRRKTAHTLQFTDEVGAPGLSPCMKFGLSRGLQPDCQTMVGLLSIVRATKLPNWPYPTRRGVAAVDAVAELLEYLSRCVDGDYIITVACQCQLKIQVTASQLGTRVEMMTLLTSAKPALLSPLFESSLKTQQTP